MAKTKLFDAWTWQRKLPEPFNGTGALTESNDAVSKYNQTRSPKATLHTPTICGIMAYMELQDAAGTGGTVKGAIGTQNSNLVVAEYPSHKGDIHAVVYTQNTGRFIVGKFTAPGDAPQTYTLKADKDSGSALFMALMPKALEDDEFSEQYANLLDHKKSGYADLEEASKCALILCDNLYRRIEIADSLSQSGIKLNIPATGNMQNFTSLNLNKGSYSPTSTLFGTFEIIKPGVAPNAPAVLTKHDDFVGKFTLSERSFSSDAKSMIPALPEWYVIPPEVVRICQHAKLTTDTKQPMRNFLLRGPAGTGKTEGAKAIAAGLGLPYVHLTCSANTEIYELLGQILPDIEGISPKNSYQASEYPSFDDIRMDPPTAYCKLTGEYNEDITEDEAYNKLVEVLKTAKPGEEKQEEPKKDKFRYVDTALVQALRYGYLCELQEPSIIANPGVLVGLNSLLDRCNDITLPTGERIQRHPDTVIVVTTNSDYAGCKPINQSVISRMNLVMDIEQPDIDTMVERVCGITGCKDLAVVKKMAETVDEISQRCRETMITDGSCGMRELIAWVQSYMICENELEAARYTILSSVSGDPENRAEIMNTCISPKYA